MQRNDDYTGWSSLSFRRGSAPSSMFLSNPVAETDRGLTGERSAVKVDGSVTRWCPEDELDHCFRVG